jgi:DNA repair exonuclease SbcCD ATPase subunit
MASKKILIQVDVTTKSAEVHINKVVESMNKLDGATAKVNKATKKNSASAGLHNAILMESGRLASDLNYGFTAIANNLGQLFSLFQASADSAEGLGAAFQKLLSIQALFLIGGQLVIQNLDKITAFFKDVVFGIKDFDKIFNKASQTVTEVNGNFELYIATLEDATKSEEEKAVAVKRLNEEYPDYIDSLNEADITLKDVENKTKAATKQNDLYRDSIMQLAIARAAENELEKISAEILQAEIDLKNEQIELGYRTQEEVDARIKQLDLLIKAEEEQEKQLKKNVKQYTGLGTAGTNLSNSINSTLAKLKEEKASLEGTQRAYLGLGESTQQRIERLKEERKLYVEFIDLRKTKVEQDKKDADNDKEYIKTKIGNVDKEVQAIKELGRIRSRFFKKNQEQDVKDKETETEKVELQRTQALAEVEAIQGNEIAKRQARLEINAFYDKKDIEAAEKTEKAKTKIAELERDAKLAFLDDVGKGLIAAGKIAGQSTGAGKALAIAGTLVSTYSAAQKAYESQMIPSIDSPIRAAIAAASAIAQGLANVKAIQSVKVAGMTSDSVSGGGATTVEAPDFNVVGAGGVSQLATTLAGVTGQPLKAFVVSKEISSAQELERNITSTASIG